MVFYLIQQVWGIDNKLEEIVEEVKLDEEEEDSTLLKVHLDFHQLVKLKHGLQKNKCLQRGLAGGDRGRSPPK